jgi:hypothetical protein
VPAAADLVLEQGLRVDHERVAEEVDELSPRTDRVGSALPAALADLQNLSDAPVGATSDDASGVARD